MTENFVAHRLLRLLVEYRIYSMTNQLITYRPYERRNAAAALQQFTFMVAQRLSVCKAVLVSR